MISEKLTKSACFHNCNAYQSKTAFSSSLPLCNLKVPSVSLSLAKSTISMFLATKILVIVRVHQALRELVSAIPDNVSGALYAAFITFPREGLFGTSLVAHCEEAFLLSIRCFLTGEPLVQISGGKEVVIASGDGVRVLHHSTVVLNSLVLGVSLSQLQGSRVDRTGCTRRNQI